MVRGPECLFGYPESYFEMAWESDRGYSTPDPKADAEAYGWCQVATERTNTYLTYVAGEETPIMTSKRDASARGEVIANTILSLRKRNV